MRIAYRWRGPATSAELNALHAAAFGHRVFADDEWDWAGQIERHSLGWVTARAGDDLAGFANVAWDGVVHAFLLDVMVAPARQRGGIGRELVRHATAGARAAGCEWLHVDFDDHLRAFYLEACGFAPTPAGVIRLDAEDG